MIDKEDIIYEDFLLNKKFIFNLNNRTFKKSNKYLKNRKRKTAIKATIRRIKRR